jgi:hypothetical protein
LSPLYNTSCNICVECCWLFDMFDVCIQPLIIMFVRANHVLS